MFAKSPDFRNKLLWLFLAVHTAASQTATLSCNVPDANRAITQKTGVLVAPVIDGRYSANQRCDWIFQVNPEQEILVVRILKLDLESDSNLCKQNGFCDQRNCVDQLELLPGEKDAKILCGTTNTQLCYVIGTSATSAFSGSAARRICSSVNGNLISSNNEFRIRFYTDSINQREGFALAFNIENITKGIQMEPTEPMFDPTQAPPIPLPTTQSTISSTLKTLTQINTLSTSTTFSHEPTKTTTIKTTTTTFSTTAMEVQASVGREILYVMAGVVAFLMVGTTLAVVILCVRRNSNKSSAQPQNNNEESENLNPYTMSDPVPLMANSQTTTTTFRQIKSEESFNSHSRSYVAANDVTVFERGRVITDRDVYCCVSVTDKPESEKQIVNNILYESAEISARRTGSYNNNMEKRSLPTPPAESNTSNV